MPNHDMLAELRRNIADGVAEARHASAADRTPADAYTEGLNDALKIVTRHTPRFDREVTVRPAYDCLEVKPCALGGDRCTEGAPGANHGRGVAYAHFALFTDTAEVRLVVDTGWHHPATPVDIRNSYHSIGSAGRYVELGHHAAMPFPGAIGVTSAPNECPRGWATCHSAITFSGGEPGVEQLITGGTDALWAWLENQWNDTFAPEGTDQ